MGGSGGGLLEEGAVQKLCSPVATQYRAGSAGRRASRVRVGRPPCFRLFNVLGGGLCAGCALGIGVAD